MPILLKFWLFPVLPISLSVEGMKKSIKAISTIPAKNAMTQNQYPKVAPFDWDRYTFAFENISIIETYSITPAEKPRERERNFVLVRLQKRAIRLPKPVDSPANTVKNNADKIFLSKCYHLQKIEL